MEFRVNWVDVTRHLLAQEQPVLDGEAINTIKRLGGPGEFWVPGVLLGAEPEPYTVVRVGEALRVPMYAYRTLAVAPAALFALGVQIGLAALHGLRQHTQDLPKTVHLVLGHECTDLRPAAAAYRAYVGIALQTR